MSSAKPAQGSSSSTRRIRLPKKPTRQHKKQAHDLQSKLPSAWSIFIGSIRHLLANKKPFTIILAVYFVLSILLVKGLGSGIELNETKTALNELFGGDGSELTTTVALFGVLLGSAGAASGEIGSLYQSILLVIVGLALIWTLRQTYAGTKVTAKDAFYTGMYPLVPYLLVIMIIGLQLIPIALAGTINAVVLTQGIAVTALETLFWLGLILGAIVLSLYWLTASIFASYVVTLPNTKPLEALRAAKKLVAFRRWTVLRKILFLPLVLLSILGLVMLPIIFYATGAAEMVFFVLMVVGLLVSHSYLYALYRELL